MAYDLKDIKSYVTGCHMMRDGALERLSDADLQFVPGGDNLTLGELFKQLGEHEHSYAQSLITLKQDWSYRNDEPGLATNLAQLRRWFAQLDQQMQDVIDSLDEIDLDKLIDRTNGSIRPLLSQLDIYTQVYLIFLGKIVVYFKAMHKPLPPSIAEYIG
ncbi:MAG: DinB family protein [Anaerolineae bacterium]|nr:DinB family protein [Anaerolineae bacterium]